MNNELIKIQDALITLRTQFSVSKNSAAGDISESAALLQVRELERRCSALLSDPATQPALARLQTAHHDLRNHHLLSLLGSGLGFMLMFLGYAAIVSKEPFKESYSASVIFEAFLNTLLFLGTFAVMFLLRRGLATSTTRIAEPAAQRSTRRALTIAAFIFVTSLFVSLCKTLPRRDGYYDNEIIKSWLSTGYSGSIGLILLSYSDLIVVGIGIVATCWVLGKNTAPRPIASASSI